MYAIKAYCKRDQIPQWYNRGCNGVTREKKKTKLSKQAQDTHPKPPIHITKRHTPPHASLRQARTKTLFCLVLSIKPKIKCLNFQQLSSVENRSSQWAPSQCGTRPTTGATQNHHLGTTSRGRLRTSTAKSGGDQMMQEEII